MEDELDEHDLQALSPLPLYFCSSPLLETSEMGSFQELFKVVLPFSWKIIQFIASAQPQ